MIAVWIILGVIALIAIWAVSSYNGLIGQRNKVEEGWRQIDVELKRRHDLIPNLVETVQGYAQHERGTLEDVMRARSAAMAGGQSPAQAAQAEGELSQALGRLIMVSEAYPELKANENFLALQRELTSTEDRIASSRRYYNALVRDLNTKVESVPSKFVADMTGIKRAEYFETPAAEAVAPNVSFGTGGAGTAGGPAGAVGPLTAPGAVAGPSTVAGGVAGPSTQPGSIAGQDVPWRAGGSDPLVTSGHEDAPGQPLPNPNVDRTSPND
ncbi:MAG: LemA family protein [Intrasporangium sp.]|uniref:LemA family protein n=1 Tax=Intrasporangium sp. TaxID=1925024 RepID=UPI002649DA1F|nr:LemA family protein [Intrasporangium sp.]MDN5796104.1 LemA family protein [Intrasporangium sp.]